MDFEDPMVQFPDGGRVSMDFRQVNIPLYSGSPIYRELPTAPKYIMHGGRSNDTFDTVDGGNSSQTFSTLDGGNSGIS